MLKPNGLAGYVDTVCPKLVRAIVDHVSGGTYASGG